ncbi:anhydro-N-acetylmuramic acid kinase [Oceanobacter mangrovi]|uniref:anhydro-N-acetylmuramic acid kinase n=1 Tax=Oceanobacter mangrovi TaxID=2862510 RepID=UPI001C8E8B1B|nr:anhydro-N-acetylmuramic acid kinase [Oceanobacter mangrovi]
MNRSASQDGLYIGLMSGTSADGIDAVLIEVQQNRIQTQAQCSIDYSADEKRQLREAAIADALAVDEILALDRFIARRSVAVVQQLLAQQQLAATDIVAVGSHGHTLRHLTTPEVKTWQIGDPAWIAEHTGICCVADFRRRDVAAGGQGAPLVPAFHQQVFASADQPCMVLNIGGIANLTVLADSRTIGFDCGPGNALMDEYCQVYLQQGYDANGQLASQGNACEDLLERWLQHPYFSQLPPKSTGRELFTLKRLHDDMARLNPADSLATLSEFTARSIARAVQDYGHAAGELLVCGGGAFNGDLMQRLSRVLPAHQLGTTASRGIHPQWVEAAAFGWLASRTLMNLSGNLATVTGARGERILGAIYPA